MRQRKDHQLYFNLINIDREQFPRTGQRATDTMASKSGLKRVNFQPDYSDDDIDLADLSPNEFEEGDEDEDEEMGSGSEEEASGDEGQLGSENEDEEDMEEGDYSVWATYLSP